VSVLNFDSPRTPRSGKSLKLALGASAVAVIVALASTLAANININSGPVEFGQGVAQTTACSGDDVITLTPQSTFVNSPTDADFYFTSLSVSGIPSSCIDTNFKFSAYSETGTALTLTECTDDGGFAPVVFFTGDEDTDQTEQSSDDMYADVYDLTPTGFSLSWHGGEGCNSVVLASQVYKVTVETSVGEVQSDYVADYTPGSTVYDPIPLFSLDAATSSPNDSVWNSISGSLALSADLETSTAETEHVDFGSVSGIADLGNALNGMDRVTVEMWIKFNNPGTPWSSRPFSFGRSVNDIQAAGYGLFFSSGNLGINTYNNDILGFPTASIDNRWRHIIWVASTGGRYTQKIYVDGVLQQLSRTESPVEDRSFRYDLSNGQIGVNLQNDMGGSSSDLKVGAINVYAGEMPQVTAVERNEFFRDRLSLT
jgi:hypothetical protein